MNIASLLAQGYDYNYKTYDVGTNAISNEAAAGIAAGFVVFALIAAVIAYVITALALGRIFKKAGEESWKGWVPVYNVWTLLELGDQKGYWAVLLLIPIVQIVAVVFMIIAMYNIGLKLGKPGAFVLLGIFLPIVWYIWLALDKSTWQGTPVAGTAQPAGVAPAPAQNTTPPSSNDNQPTPPTA